jgi:tetratricopeptide (TPR) repeat protein
MEGDFAAAHATADALLKIAEEQGLALWLGWGATIRGYVVAVQQDSERGLAELRTGIEAARRSGSQLMYTYHLGLLADALVHAGRYDEAVATLDEADTFAATNEERFWIPELQRLRGLIALAAGDLERAHGLFAEGLAVAAQQSAHSLAARLQASQSHARS